jgi:hypothetical protein
MGLIHLLLLEKRECRRRRRDRKKIGSGKTNPSLWDLDISFVTSRAPEHAT